MSRFESSLAGTAVSDAQLLIGSLGLQDLIEVYMR